MNDASADAAKSGARTRDGVAAELAGRRAAIVAERDQALARLEAEHQRRLAAVEARAAQARTQLQHPTKDLAATRRAVTNAMRAIDEQSDVSDRDLRAEVGRSDRRLHADVARDLVQLGAEAKRALAALDALERRARQRIADDAARGEAGMARQVSTGERELERLAARGIAEAARDAPTAIDPDVATGITTLDHAAAALPDDIGESMVDIALAEARADIPAAGAAPADPERAQSALNTLNGLPSDLARKAMDQLDTASFGYLIASVDEARLEEVDTMFRDGAPPERRLELWADVHRARATRELDASMARTDADTTLTPEARARRHAATQRILDDTMEETSDEVTHLEAKHPASTDVDALVARKELEHQIELRHNVDLTNDVDANLDSHDEALKPTTRTAWSVDELQLVEASLGRLPADQVLGDGLLPPMPAEGGLPGLARRFRSMARRVSATFSLSTPKISSTASPPPAPRPDGVGVDRRWCSSISQASAPEPSARSGKQAR